MRFVRPVAAFLLVAQAACLPELPPPPTRGYGAPYAGTGKPIYVKDSRNDWQASEGGRPITSEQALEATKDEEYEIRRQAAKAYNEKIHVEGQSNRSLGKVLMYAGTGVAVAGFAVMFVLPSALRETTTTPRTATEPEVRVTEAGGASTAALLGGLLVGLAGIGMIAYGYVGGSKDPPYHLWRTPSALDRPAYVREKTEAYNERIGAPPVEEQPGAVETIPLAPGQRKQPPPKPPAHPSAPGAASPGHAPGAATPGHAPGAATPGHAPTPRPPAAPTAPPTASTPRPPAAPTAPLTPPASGGRR
ncbi:MAG: hypothetical protein KIT84_44630 [Labilithrix sp.]|nr:hypothetical protein [Labilithrix sp.]MCW5818167.1 hypothetical protein [Labilithrix sp.]